MDSLRLPGFKTKHSVPYGQSNYWFKGQWTQQIVKSNPLIAKADSPTINPLQWLYILILFLIKGRFAIWRLEAEWKYKGPPCWSPTVQDSRSATAVPSFQPRLLPLLKNQDLAHSEIQPVLFFSWGIKCMFTTALLTFLHSGFKSIELDYFALFANLQYHIRLPQINQ